MKDAELARLMLDCGGRDTLRSVVDPVCPVGAVTGGLVTGAVDVVVPNPEPDAPVPDDATGPEPVAEPAPDGTTPRDVGADPDPTAEPDGRPSVGLIVTDPEPNTVGAVEPPEHAAPPTSTSASSALPATTDRPQARPSRPRAPPRRASGTPARPVTSRIPVLLVIVTPEWLPVSRSTLQRLASCRRTCPQPSILRRYHPGAHDVPLPQARRLRRRRTVGPPDCRQPTAVATGSADVDPVGAVWSSDILDREPGANR